ncbi:MAG: hypothetical protein FGM15_07920 [Chthoniobacterales bacterium]|nr:hypothetical protein [Chthoniobacterales bacterium]
MFKHARTTFLVMFAAVSTLRAQGERIAFDFTGVSPALNLPWTKTSVMESGLTTQGWTAGAGITPATGDNRLAFSVSSDANLSTLAQARANSAFLSVRVASSSQTLNLNSNRVAFTIRRENWHSPLQYAVFTSVDNFTSPVFATPLLDNSNTATDDFSFLIPATGYGNLSGSVEFRIYPFSARYTGHAASLTAFSIRSPVQTYTLNLTATAGGSASTAPSGSTFEAGQVVQVTATPAAGYTFSGWTGDATGETNPLSVTMNSDLSVVANFLPKPAPRMDLGGNLDALTDWTTAWVFKDCFKLARTWMTRSASGSEWESNQTPLTDANGWPLAVPFTPAGGSPQILHTLLPLYGPGIYTVRLQGVGRVDLIPPNGGARQTVTAAGGTTVRTFTFSPTLADNMLYLEVRESSGSNPVRNIEIIAPGQDTKLAAEPFHLDFIASLAPYRCLRFMDWMQTNLLPWENVTPLSDWAQRTTAATCTQTRREGVAHEYVIALANQTHKDPWICIPHAADDNYVRETARLYRDALDPDLELYVEYSNETWNGGFMQTTYIQDRGKELGLDPDRWQAGQKFVARRSAEIFAIFGQEFGTANRHRVVNVLATQAAGAGGVTQTRIDAMANPAINASGTQPDALAIAPYFGVNYEPGDAVPTAAQVVTTLSQAAIAEATAWTKEHRQLADERGWRLVCYEGGQHFVGIAGAENNATLTGILHAANRDARMQERYREYLVALESEGVDLFVNFSHVSGWSQWGSWGVIEHQQQPAADAPKWRALSDWALDLAARRDAVSVLPSAPGGTWSLRATLRPGRRYAVESSTDLAAWSTLAGLENIRGDGVTAELDVPVASEQRRFWRLRSHD